MPPFLLSLSEMQLRPPGLLLFLPHTSPRTLSLGEIGWPFNFLESSGTARHCRDKLRASSSGVHAAASWGARGPPSLPYLPFLLRKLVLASWG